MQDIHNIGNCWGVLGNVGEYYGMLGSIGWGILRCAGEYQVEANRAALQLTLHVLMTISLKIPLLLEMPFNKTLKQGFCTPLLKKYFYIGGVQTNSVGPGGTMNPLGMGLQRG